MKLFKKEFAIGLLVIAIIITLMGVMVIYSASNPLKTSQSHLKNFFKSHAFKQMLFLTLGVAVSLVIFMASPRFISFITWIVYPINVILLILVLAVGDIRMGAQRWLSIGGFSVQPSEFCKITIILALAQYMSWNYDNRKSLGFFVSSFLIAGVPMVLIMKQPDLGTSMIIVPILYTMLFFVGANFFYLISTVVAALAAAPLFWMKLAQYQKNRILTFMNPSADPTGTGYTILQSKVAVGSGGFAGKGWFHGTQTQLGFLPEKHTDFIFSVVGEEWGFIGGFILVFMYLLLLFNCLAIADRSRTIYGKTAAVGLTMMIFSHMFINMCMTIGLLPVVGLPLPLISYGGSALLTAFITIGLLLNFNAQRFRF